MDSDEAALKRAIHERPMDDTPQLVLADYYDDNGRPDEAEARRFLVNELKRPGDEFGQSPIFHVPGYARRIRPHVLTAADEMDRSYADAPHEDKTALSTRALQIREIARATHNTAASRRWQQNKALAKSPPTREAIDNAVADGVGPHDVSSWAWTESRVRGSKLPVTEAATHDAHAAAMSEHDRLARHWSMKTGWQASVKRTGHEEARNLHHAAAIMLRESANSPAE